MTPLVHFTGLQLHLTADLQNLKTFWTLPSVAAAECFPTQPTTHNTGRSNFHLAMLPDLSSQQVENL